jgi:predicted kinase
MPTLHLICGLPGSGKSRLAAQLERQHPALRLTPDEWMSRIVGSGYDEQRRMAIETIQWEIAQRALRLGVHVILENGFWSRKERDHLRAQARELGAAVKLHFLDVPRDELWRRLNVRNQQLPTHTFPIKETDLDQWVAQFEPPTSDETASD